MRSLGLALLVASCVAISRLRRCRSIATGATFCGLANERSVRSSKGRSTSSLGLLQILPLFGNWSARTQPKAA